MQSLMIRRSVGRMFPSVMLVLLLACGSTTFARQSEQDNAQQNSSSRVLTDADYANAEKFMAYNVDRLVYGTVRPTWLPGHRFWYRSTNAEGSDFVIVNAASGERRPAFDHAAVAAALSSATGGHYNARDLPFASFDFSKGEHSIFVAVKGKQWECTLEPQANCSAASDDAELLALEDHDAAFHDALMHNESISPDGKTVAFIRDYNLWMRDLASGKETQLTTDGVKDFGYATDNAGWTHSDRPIVAWSPDSTKIATFQQDQRGDGDMYLVHTNIGHPTLEEWKYPLPGDKMVTMIQRVVIDVNSDAPRVIRFKMPPDEHRSTLCDDIACTPGVWTDVQWSPDSTHVAFVSTSRDHKHERFRVADASTGDVRDVFGEDVATFYTSGIGAANWRYLPASNEAIWYSSRSNWGQLYLYNLETGQMEHQITSGDGDVAQLLRVDEKNRVLYFTAVGKQRGVDPYYIHFYSIDFDGKNLTLLTAEKNFTHQIALSPDGRYFVDSYSTPEVSSVTVVRDDSGNLVATVSKADISRLVADGWKPPISFTVKARDGATDLYGLMFKPTHFDPQKKYPIINHIYPGPQTGSVGSRNFSAARGDCQSLAELGFVVIELDGMGTPWRSQKFQEAYYGDMGDDTLPDQVAGMKQLAQRYPWIDITRAGIYGHSGGGFATADAMFRYPDFFKVGIAESGNHDNRDYEDDWGEKWQGLLVRYPNGTTNYDNQANELVAKNLKGHLMLAYGTIDNNVPPYNTLLVVNALIKANKDFDLIALPNERHGYADDTPYMTRRRWDYFVRYLMDATPPHEYEMHAPANPFGPPRF
ncbi:MAG TPA: DPP IV N-terminal domain-containing protein [Candidatus Acidoferrum sp.]|nr:DPP IV N-terminal domain-containing protein [Candidatus Acidoferrum sp.]